MSNNNKMNHPVLRQKAIDLIIAINAAITNARLYPPTSSLIVNSASRMYQSVQALLSETEIIEYAESEQKLLVQGELLSDKEQKKPQAESFLNLITDLGLRSISIKKDITENEIVGFIQIMKLSPDDLAAAGGIKKVFEDKNIIHISADEQIYVKLDSDHRIVSEMNISDKDIASYLLGGQTASDQDLDQIRELLKKPDAVSRIFKEGVQQVMADPKDGEQLSEAMISLIEAFKKLSPETREDHSKEILNTLTDMDDNFLLSILTRDMGDVFGEKVFKGFIGELEDSRFETLMTRITGLVETVSGDDAYSSSQTAAISHVLDMMRDSEKGKTLSEKAEKSEEVEEVEEVEDVPDITPPDSREKKIEKLTLALSSILKGKSSMFPAVTGVDGLAAAVRQMADKGKNFTVNSIIERLGNGLQDENKKVRDAAAELLSKIDDRLDEATHFDEKIMLSRKLTEWLKYESEISPVYEKIANQLQQTAQQMIRQEKFEEAHEIIDTYHRMYTGNLNKDDAITALSENMLQNISTEDILDILLRDGPTDDISRQKKDIHSLIIMGTTTVERFLDRLHDSHNRSERRRIIEVITKIGNPAVTPVVERLRQEGPWFYLRNLVMLLGRIGSDLHLKLLESMLMHEDLRVQREAIFAIQAIDAGKTGEILLRNLYTVDPENFGLMISDLGLLKYRGAVPVLVEMLESGSPGGRKKDKKEIMIKICEALGKIGDEDAIQPLENVMRSKGFFSIRSVDPEILEAAKAAIGRMKNEE